MNGTISVRDIRISNKRNILHSLIKGGSMSRNEIAADNQISIVTVKNVVDELLSQNVIVESKVETTIAGRKPSFVSLNSRIGCVVCITLASADVFHYAIFQLDQTKLRARKLECDSAKTYLQQLHVLLQTIISDLAEIGQELIGIGIAVPGLYNKETDRASNELIYALGEISLRALVEEYFNPKLLVIDNDINLAASAEGAAIGVERPHQGLYYIYVGEGIGGSYISGGDAFSGKYHYTDGDAGQIFVCLQGSGALRLEERASTSAILATAAARGMRFANFPALLTAYQSGSGPVVSIMDDAIEMFNRAMYNIVHLLNPVKIIIGSSYTAFSAMLAESLSGYLSSMYLSPRLPEKTSVVESYYGEESAHYGLLNRLTEEWIDHLTQIPLE